MGIRIENDEVERLIRRMADRTGLSMTEAVRVAVEGWLAHGDDAPSEESERQRRIDETLARLRARPVRDAREHGDMLCGPDGLPR